MLCCVGFVFNSPAALMYGTRVTWRLIDVLRADLEDELPDGFEERKPFDVAGRSADFRDDNVRFAFDRDFADAVLDLVGDVRNHLHGLAEIIAAAFLHDHHLVDLTAGEVVVPGEDAIGETLVVSEVEVGLGAVVQDVNFAVLEGVHRPGIDVEIGIEFLEDDAQSAQFQEGPEGGGGEAFA